MKSSKLAGILASFSKEQWNQFEHFLHLPYLKVHKRHHDIYDYLKSRYRRQVKNKASKENLFPLKNKLNVKFFPDNRKDYRQLNKHLSKLHRHAQSFLALEQVRNNSNKLDLVSTQIAIHAKEFHYAQVIINRLWKEMEKDTDDWFLRSELCFANNLLQSNIDPKKKISSLVKVEESLDDLYIFHQIRNYCLQFTQQIKFGIGEIEYRPYFEDYIEHYIARRQYTPILFRIYYCILKILKRKNAPSFLHALTQLLQNNKANIPNFHIKEVQRSLINHHTLLYSAEKISGQELLNIYQIFLESETLVEEDGHLSIRIYRNLVGLSIKAKAYSWLKTNLIDSYLYLLPKEYQKNASLLANSEYQIGGRNWRAAFDLAIQIDSDALVFKLSKGVLLVQAAYEIEKAVVKALPSRYDFIRTLQNFIALINYHKTKNKSTIQSYLHFSNIIQRIYNIENAKNQKYRATKIYNSITNYKLIPKKDWLLDKASMYQ